MFCRPMTIAALSAVLTLTFSSFAAAKRVMRFEVGAAVGGSMDAGGGDPQSVEGGGVIAGTLDFSDGPGLSFGLKGGIAGAGDTQDQFFWMATDAGLLARYTVPLGSLKLSGYLVGGGSMLQLEPEFVLTTDRIIDVGYYAEGGVDLILPITEGISMMVAVHHSIRGYGEVEGSVTPLLASGEVSVTVEDFTVQHTMAVAGVALSW
ncbi:MAG: hypothetical protein ACE366_28565 [Bradymonadia bacterium]